MICLPNCKNDKIVNNGQTSVNGEIFRVIINVKVLEDDKFQLFYVDDSSEGKYNINKRTVTYVNGKNEFQSVEFKLPANVLPRKFRIDVGENNYETAIDIKEIEIKFNNNLIKINDKVLERFFQPNQYLKKLKNNYMRIKIDGRYDPFIDSTPLLIKKIELEL